MTTYYKATFSNGIVLTRSSASRKYSHAYLIKGTYTEEAKARWLKHTGHPLTTWSHEGFSGRIDLAEKAANPGYDADSKVITFREVVPTVEITRAECKALSNPTGFLAGRAR